MLILLLFKIVSVQNAIFEYIKVPSVIADFPNLEAHFLRIANLPGVKEYLVSEKSKRPLMPPHIAKIPI